MVEKYKLYLGNTRKVVAEMVEKGRISGYDTIQH
jgi:hypothetical protein